MMENEPNFAYRNCCYKKSKLDPGQICITICYHDSVAVALCDCVFDQKVDIDVVIIELMKVD